MSKLICPNGHSGSFIQGATSRSTEYVQRVVGNDGKMLGSLGPPAREEKQYTCVDCDVKFEQIFERGVLVRQKYLDLQQGKWVGFEPQGDGV
jgi:hypothetical protein